MSTTQELQAQIDKMAIELDNLRKQAIEQRTPEFRNRVINAEEKFIANRARESGIDMSAPLPDDSEYEKALRIAAAESKARIAAQENERKDWQELAKSLKDKKGGKSRKLGRKLGRSKLGRKLSLRQHKRSRHSKR